MRTWSPTTMEELIEKRRRLKERGGDPNKMANRKSPTTILERIIEHEMLGNVEGIPPYQSFQR